MSQSPTLPQRPANDDKEGWKIYWEAQGQSWRTEPEIDLERQKYLDYRRSITPSVEMGVYPFKYIQLTRADIEWLLATHDNGRGPIDWGSEKQFDPHLVRKGLDLRGANLSNMDLRSLPLARLIGDLIEYGTLTDAQREAESINMEGANLYDAHLEGASLSYAHLGGANLHSAHLEKANLSHAYLERANLERAQLKGTFLPSAHLERANFFSANLENAVLSGARLDSANLWGANLKTANLFETHLERADLTRAHLENAHLARSFLDGATKLDDICLGNKKDGFILLSDIHWNDVNLAVVDWSSISVLGDEPTTERQKWFHLRPKVRTSPVRNYPKAVRAYRQLSVVLRNQGLNEDAARFAYHAQLMQRKVFWYQGIRKFAQYLFSLFLDLLAGYGYKPWRSFAAYIVVIGIFAAIYFHLGPHLAWNEAIVISMTAFHGRGFFPDQFKPGDPQALVAAIEAFVGLLIEVTFIATLTQRLFGK